MGAHADLRLVQRDAMEIVSEAEFLGVFRAAGRLDILEAGTGCPQTDPTKKEKDMRRR